MTVDRGLPELAASRASSLSETVKSWLPVAAIIATGGWAGYTFFYEKVWLPQTAPINILVNLHIQEAGVASAGEAKQPLSAVNVEMTASNPSTRTVYLLPSLWMIDGRKVTSANLKKDDIYGSIVSAINENGLYYAERYVDSSNVDMIAGGRAFEDSSLKPSEAIHRSIVVHFPQKGYDLLDLYVYVPTVTIDGKVDLKWILTKDGHDFSRRVYIINSDGSETEMQQDKNGDYLGDSFGLQAFHSEMQLSLWH